MTPLQRIQRTHVRLMRSEKFAFMSGIVACGNVTISDCPTAYTDGWNVVYGDKFISKLTDNELAFLVLHENFHKLMRQLTVWTSLFKTDATRANMAADYVVNLMIADLDPNETVASVIDSALLDAQYRNMSTKEVFEALGKRGKGKGASDNPEPMDAHGWGQEVTPEEQRERDKMIEVATRQGAILAGKLNGNLPRGVLEVLEPKVNWREALRDFVTSVTNGRDASTWRRPNRRHLHQGVYMPSMYSESMGELIVAIDTSGSIRERELSEFASELVSICDTMAPSKLTLLWWDATVCGVQEFEGDYTGLASALIPVGGGGTSFRCVGEYIHGNNLMPECVIALTDGYVSDWGAPLECPTLFAITSNITAPYGVTVRMEA